MTPSSTASRPAALHAAHRRRLRAGSPATSEAAPHAAGAPWWQETLARLEAREAEASARALEATAELHRARLDNDRLTAVLAARDAALAESAKREARARDDLGAWEVEALEARTQLLELAEAVKGYQDQVASLIETRDTALKRAGDAAMQAQNAETRLRTTTKSLRSRTEQATKLERKLATQERKLASQERKLESLQRRSDQLDALRSGGAYRVMTLMWRVKRFFVRR